MSMRSFTHSTACTGLWQSPMGSTCLPITTATTTCLNRGWSSPTCQKLLQVRLCNGCWGCVSTSTTVFKSLVTTTSGLDCWHVRQMHHRLLDVSSKSRTLPQLAPMLSNGRARRSCLMYWTSMLLHVLIVWTVCGNFGMAPSGYPMPLLTYSHDYASSNTPVPLVIVVIMQWNAA